MIKSLALKQIDGKERVFERAGLAEESCSLKEGERHDVP